jgi:hypothetical protein
MPHVIWNDIGVWLGETLATVVCYASPVFLMLAVIGSIVYVIHISIRDSKRRRAIIADNREHMKQLAEDKNAP